MSRANLRQYLYNKKPDDFYALFDGFAFGMVDLPANLADGFVLPMLSTDEIFSSPDNHNQVPVILGSNRDEPSLFMFRDPRYVELFLGFIPRFVDRGQLFRTGQVRGPELERTVASTASLGP